MVEPFIVTIRPGVAFEPGAAASWRRMENAAGRAIDVNSSYRDYDAQMIAYNAYRSYVNGTGPWAPFALHPDRSMHCKGLAVDTDDQSLIKAMPSHGWRQTALNIGEPWHFDYIRAKDDHQGEGAGGGSEPIDPPVDPLEEEDMDTRSIITRSADAPKFELLRGTKRSIGREEWQAMRAVEKAGGPQLAVAIVTQAILDGIPGV